MLALYDVQERAGREVQEGCQNRAKEDEVIGQAGHEENRSTIAES